MCWRELCRSSNAFLGCWIYYHQCPLPACQNNLWTVSPSSSSQHEASESRGHQHYGISNDDVVDILVSCDGTWQWHGFSSLFGAVFIIAHKTWKVVDYIVKSKHYASCMYWEKQDKTTDTYKTWKETHECEINFTCSTGAMEPQGTLEMFQS